MSCESAVPENDSRKPALTNLLADRELKLTNGPMDHCVGLIKLSIKSLEIFALIHQDELNFLDRMMNRDRLDGAKDS